MTTGAQPSLPHGRFGLLMVLFFASGAAALIYEVLWLKELGRLFGVTAHSAAATLSVFFLGLSAGGLVWGRCAASIVRPLGSVVFVSWKSPLIDRVTGGDGVPPRSGDRMPPSPLT